MRNIQNTEVANWNPVPLVRGQEDWESNKQDNFGQVLFPPIAPRGMGTIPGVYMIPAALGEIGLGTGKIRIYVTDLTGEDVLEITSNCIITSYADHYYLSVPAVTYTPPLDRNSNIVFLRFVGLDKAQGWTNRMLCSEPYRLNASAYDTQDTVEKQSQVILRWWSANDLIIEKGNDEYYLPYAELDHCFELGFDAQLSKPEYKKNQDGSERDGLFFPEKTVITKEYHFFFNAPEYLLDALRYVHLADFVEIQQGITHLAVDSIDFNIKWEKAGNVAKVDCSFTTGTVLRKLGTMIY